MRHRAVVNLTVLMIAMILALPATAQQKPVAPTPPGAGAAKPFTQDQVQAMVRDGLGDETGGKAIEQHGPDLRRQKASCRTSKRQAQTRRSCKPFAPFPLTCVT